MTEQRTSNMMKGLRVYIAGPLESSGDQDQNIQDALDIADRAWQAGMVPYVPHLTAYWKINSNINRLHHEWVAYDKRWLAVCDILLRLPGCSAGADEEVRFADMLGIPVYRFNTLNDTRHFLGVIKRNKM